VIVWMTLIGLVACKGEDPADPSPSPEPTGSPSVTESPDTGSGLPTGTTPPTPTAATGSTSETGTPFTGTLPLPFADGRPPRHLLMLSIDTLRRDALTRYGGDGSMDFLDGLLDDSYALDDHLACSNWTLHSTSCAMTGAQPMSWGFLPTVMGTPVPPLPPGIEMIPGWLGDEGFVSALVTTNNIFSSNLNNATGFDEEYRAPNTRSTPAAVAGEELRQRMLAMPKGSRRYGHLHLMEPHQPYAPPIDYLSDLIPLGPIAYDLGDTDGHNAAVYDLITGALTGAEADKVIAHMKIRYRGELQYLDDQLEAWWATMQADGLLDDTLVVVWTDHGEQFFEHGYQTHAWTLHDEETEALLFFWSDQLSGVQHSGPTSGIDMAPTVLASLGVPVPSSIEGLTVDQIPADRPRFTAVSGKGGVFQAVVTPTHKLHYGWTDPADPPEFAPYSQGIYVYDRVADPDEATNLFDAGDPTTQDLWNLLLPQVEAALPLTTETPTWPAGLPQP